MKRDSAEERKLHIYSRYRVMLRADPVPAFAELQERFRLACIEYWNPEKYRLVTHGSCGLVTETVGEREFCLGGYWQEDLRSVTGDEAIEDAKRLGLRPATFNEQLQFAAAHPNPGPGLMFWIIALGSFAEVDDWHMVPIVCNYGGLERALGGRPRNSPFSKENRFLFVNDQAL